MIPSKGMNSNGQAAFDSRHYENHPSRICVYGRGVGITTMPFFLNGIRISFSLVFYKYHTNGDSMHDHFNSPGTPSYAVS